jgi:hypothetical protein
MNEQDASVSQLNRFIAAVSADEATMADVADMTIREMWAYSRGKTYTLTREQFSQAIRDLVAAKVTLPPWLRKRIDLVQPNWLD